MAETDGWTLLSILGLTVVSVVTRSFFFISERPWKLPHWAQRGLQYAPIAALMAVITPDIFMLNGQLTAPWRDARVWAAIVAALAEKDETTAVRLMQEHLLHVEAGLTFDRELPTSDLSMALSSVAL